MTFGACVKRSSCTVSTVPEERPRRSIAPVEMAPEERARRIVVEPVKARKGVEAFVSSVRSDVVGIFALHGSEVVASLHLSVSSPERVVRFQPEASDHLPVPSLSSSTPSSHWTICKAAKPTAAARSSES